MSTSDCRVHVVRSLISNAYLLQGDRTIIVDTGVPGNATAMLRQMLRHDISPDNVSLILLTHGHIDHFGSAAELKRHTGAPIAIHAADAPSLRTGTNPPLLPTCAMGRILKPFFQHRQIEPCEPDMLIEEEARLDVFGVSARIVFTPGHTSGSLSVLTSSGDLIAGDLLIGGCLGGHIASGWPGLPYFLDDLALIRHSIHSILKLSPTRIHVGHGGPLDPARVRRAFPTS